MAAASLPMMGETTSKILLLVNPFLCDEILESTGMAGEAQAFLRAQAQESLAYERVTEKLDGSILQGAVEIDQHFAAGEQVHLAEHRIGHQTMAGKHHPLPQGAIERGLSI